MADTVIVVNSHVARGGVGGRVSTFVLERAGFPVVSVPTVTLAWHPGLGPSTRETPNDFAALVADLAGAPWFADVGAVLSGYLGAPEQPEAVAGLVDAVRRVRNDAFYLCDPVIGDANGLYVSEAVAVGIRDHLVPRADIVTPNVAELSWLVAGQAGPMAAPDIEDFARRLGVAEAVVTSAPGSGGQIGAALFGEVGEARADHPALDDVPHGTGDLLAAGYLARRLQGETPEAALERATAATFSLARQAVAMKRDALPLAEHQELLGF